LSALDGGYTKEVQSLNLAPFSVAQRLVVENDDVNFRTALDSLNEVQRTIDADATAASRLDDVLDDTQPRFLLTVKGDSIHVVYGLRKCRQLQQKVVGLMGDRHRYSNVLRDPTVVVVPGQPNTHVTAFGYVNTPAKPLQTIREEFLEANEGAVVVGAAVGGAQIKVPKLLPVHPKLAVLFMQGVRIPDAVAMVDELNIWYQSDTRANLGPLINFCRAAATGQGNKSVLEIKWSSVNQHRSDALLQWCCGLVSQHAPLPDNGKPQGQETGQSGEAGQEATTQLLVSSVHKLVESLSGSHRAKKVGYSDLQLAGYSALAGGVSGSDAFGESLLTEFYKTLQTIPRKGNGLRLYLEEELNKPGSDDPEADPELTTVVSTHLLDAIRDMDFVGGDVADIWEMRERGFSLFNCAPAPTHLMGAAKLARDACVAYEETASQHRPADAKEKSRMTTTVEPWPSSADRLRLWVVAFCRRARVVFGPTCVLLAPLRKILKDMRKGGTWQAFEPQDIKALTWKIHAGIRQMLRTKGEDESILRRVHDDLQVGEPPSRRLPSEILEHIQGSTGPQSSRSTRGVHETDPTSENPTKKQKLSATVSGPDFTKHWADDLAKVRKEIPKLTGSAFCKDPDKIKEMFGSAFLSLMPPGKQACMNYFILSKCYDGCQRSHSTTSAPSPQVIAGIRERVQAHCQQLLAKNA
jgi:hypothetical protein